MSSKILDGLKFWTIDEIARRNFSQKRRRGILRFRDDGRDRATGNLRLGFAIARRGFLVYLLSINKTIRHR
ncbi:hypothetical protein IQ249_22260 [Lusitaniella coriacea LEGE 07157]|uniref:Uncharacterized protein n=1 Tax=Lusitaniella coriacea LEGE 07157 TaxID=945747 RepID=A0A8J7E1R3_9CYAN|nr:hypothetical protein [Lusitaniella coriacea]MBE9118617.1 hypothetical protein [Lusitaniella coriacea LEGE 07157]